jgi:transcriptional regulator with XRE-family HTH domain
MNKKIGKLFGELLKELRNSKNLTRDILSEKSQMHVNSIYLLEKGINEPKLSTIIYLAEALEVPVQEIMETIHKKLKDNRLQQEQEALKEYY